MRSSLSLLLAGALGAGILGGCAGGSHGPDLDRAVAGMPEASIRAEIAGHQDWGTRLTPEELDLLAAYIGQVAGRSPAAAPTDAGPTPPGLVLWRANGCGSCHRLSAAGGTPEPAT